MFPFETHRDSRNNPESVYTTNADSPSRNSPILPTHHLYSPISNTNNTINNEKTTHSNVFTSFLSRVFALFRHSPATSNDVAPPQHFGVPGSNSSLKFFKKPIWTDDTDDTSNISNTSNTSNTGNTEDTEDTDDTDDTDDTNSRNNFVTSFFSRTFSGVRTAYNATTKFVSQQIKSASFPAKIPQFTYMSITDPNGAEAIYPYYPVKHQPPETYVSTVKYLMEMLTQPQTVPDIEWIHPKLSGSVNYSPCIDVVTINILLEHYGIDINTITTGNNTNNDLRYRFTYAIMHILLLAAFGDDKEVDIIETADICYPKLSNIVERNLFRLRDSAYMQATLLMRDINKPSSGDSLDGDDITKLVRTVAICHLILKQDSICNTVLELKNQDVIQHLLHITFITTKVNHYGADNLALGIQSIFNVTNFHPVELLKILEISLGLSIVPAKSKHCISLEHCLPNLWPHRRLNVATFESLTGGINRPPIPIPVCGYWTAGSCNPSKLYFRNLKCDGGVNCSLRCHDVYSVGKDMNPKLIHCKKSPAHKSPVAFYNPKDHQMIQNGMFELRFDWRILAIFFTMAAILVGIIVYQNVLIESDNHTDIRMLLNVLLAVFTGLATALNKLYWPETSFHDFIACKRAITKFSEATQSGNVCAGCLTTYLFLKQRGIACATVCGNMNLTIGAIDNSKLKDLVIDGPGTTTCLHRAPFYFVHAFEIFSETYADYVKKYFVNFASLPCDELFHATFRLQNGKYVAKPELSFLALGDDRTSWVQIVAVVHHNPDDGAKVHWLDRPVLVTMCTTPLTPTNFIR